MYLTLKKATLIFLSGLFVSVNAFAQITVSAGSTPADTVVSKAIVAKPDTPQRSKTILRYAIPAAFISYGIVSLNNPLLKKEDHAIHDAIRRDHPNFSTHVDNYLQYTPGLAVYGLDIAGIKGKNNFQDRSVMLLISGALTATSVTLLKNAAHRLRPNEEAYNSFPSGHTATAFALAEFMNQEYGEVSPWYSIAGYTAATATGVLRLYNNKHWLSDVVAGAGFGIISTKISYLVYPYLKRKIGSHRPLKLIVTPTFQSGKAGIGLYKQF